MPSRIVPRIRAASESATYVLAGLAWRMLVDAHNRASADLGDRWLKVRYEDLLRDPRPVLTGILEHLGLKWNDAFAAGVGR